MSKKRWFEFLRWVMLMGVMAWTASGVAQEAANRAEPSSPGSVSDSVRELREQVRELQAAVAGMTGSEPARKRRNCAGSSMKSAPEQDRGMRW